MGRQTSTVKIKTKQGQVDYAKVAARLAAIHEDTTSCDITTEVTFHEFGSVYGMCRAKVATERGEYTGHSLVIMSKDQKVIEKLETIAVGRALAFAGYLSSGDIASFEEMVEHEGSHNSFIDSAMKRIEGADNAGLDSLRQQITQMVDDGLMEPGPASQIITEIAKAKLEQS